jgi:uncharacterized tellurite resistance protein B-like protein
MIEALKRLLGDTAQAKHEDREHARHLAAAALLVEVARADFTQSAQEEAAMAELLRDRLLLSDAECADLLDRAGARVDAATSLFEFTRLVNDSYDAEEKAALIGDLWRVAYADSHIDRYEEHLIRRVAELIYVPHEVFIREKLSARVASTDAAS